jgi:mannose-1-phosphate guanylyltransferase/mannose-6-phosphate isomerase
MSAVVLAPAPASLPELATDTAARRIFPVVLCGGSGTRLWPLSREAMPKQFLRLTSSRSLLQETLLRLRGLPATEPPIIVANEEHRFMVAEQLRQIDSAPLALLLEPVARNTAAAIAIAALQVATRDPQGVMLVLPSDHLIPDTAAFQAAVTSALPAAAAGLLVTFGIRPQWPETGYGYIESGEPLAIEGGCRKVARFVEKPDAAKADEFVSAGRFLWNSGMFLFPATGYLQELARVAPAVAHACRAAAQDASADLDFVRIGREAFARSPSVSVDHAVLEKTPHAAVLPVQYGWTDLGSWHALWDAVPKDAEGNVLVGDVTAQASSGNYVRAESRLVATLGVRDLVVIETADAVLVADKHQVQHLRGLVERLRAVRRNEVIAHRTVRRPWGSFDSVDAGDRFQVKRITVNPGGKLSLQMHHHRAEHWVVVSGTARITRGDEVVLLSENESTFIPLGVRHRLENPGRIPLELIEIQSGPYLGEDDIVRFEDVYQRA